MMQIVLHDCCEYTIFTSITSAAQVEHFQFEREIHMTHCHASQSLKSLLTSSLTCPVVSENSKKKKTDCVFIRVSMQYEYSLHF